jgi:hypothetical protein
MGQNMTGSSSLFLQNAEEIAARLRPLDGPLARSLSREADDLVALFRSWATARPADPDRIAAIQQMFDLNRRAMDFLSRLPPSARGQAIAHAPDDDEDDDAGPKSLPASSRRT